MCAARPRRQGRFSSSYPAGIRIRFPEIRPARVAISCAVAPRRRRVSRAARSAPVAVPCPMRSWTTIFKFRGRDSRLFLTCANCSGVSSIVPSPIPGARAGAGGWARGLGSAGLARSVGRPRTASAGGGSGSAAAPGMPNCSADSGRLNSSRLRSPRLSSPRDSIPASGGIEDSCGGAGPGAFGLGRDLVQFRSRTLEFGRVLVEHRSRAFSGGGGGFRLIGGFEGRQGPVERR